MKKTENSKLGFTLAEILITLSIIGIVAALTIPTLIQRTGNEELVSRLQKAYSTLSQATEAIITENGGVKTWAISDEAVYDLYKKHLRVAKDCGTRTGCFKQASGESINKRYKTLNGEDTVVANENDKNFRRMILSDGTQAAFGYTADAQCRTDSTKRCAVVFIDINGEKGPNTWGRDAFTFHLKETGLYPAGSESEYETDTERLCNGAGNGWYCAARIIAEGAMNY